MVRNVLLLSAVGLLTVGFGYPHLAWLPVMAFTAVSMYFGANRRGGHFWWAVILEEQASVMHMVVVSTLFACAVLSYALVPLGAIRIK